MSKVTSERHVTVPKAIADEYGIKPGDEISWSPAGDAIRVEAGGEARSEPDLQSRLAQIDEATERQRRRQSRRRLVAGARARGWTREELYRRWWNS
jgi:bifunctional DNA-binding transcriptional regulator/antitoxin component of YhaV-PrlF toxin-antitoxin module